MQYYFNSGKEKDHFPYKPSFQDYNLCEVNIDGVCYNVCRRGYADGEIEALFAKYDIDGDRVLDMEEQRRMLEDLSDQKVRGDCDCYESDADKALPQQSHFSLEARLTIE